MPLLNSLSNIGSKIKSGASSAYNSKPAQKLLGRAKEGLGMVAMGYLLIPSYSEITEPDESGKKLKFKDEDELIAMSKNAQKAILDAAKKKLDSIKKADGSNGNMANQLGLASAALSAADINKKSEDDDDPGVSVDGYFPLQVQYNPSSITLTTYNGKQITNRVDMGADAAAFVGQQDVECNTIMSMTLIFEAVNNDDAFIVSSESVTNVLTVSGAKTTAMNAVKKVGSLMNDDENATEGGYTVRPIVEGLLSLKASKALNDVFFCYGRTFFHGYITNISPTYKMFNKSGDPIYAEVNLSIQQSNERDEDLQLWLDSYKKVFSQEDDSILGANSTSLTIDANSKL